MQQGRFFWDETKNIRLKADRGVGFEDIVQALVDEKALDEITHPKRPNQFIYVVEFRD